MTDNWKTPTSFSMNVHTVDEIKSDASAAVNGALHIRALRDGYETFDVTLFTGDAKLAVSIAKAITRADAEHAEAKKEIV